jgi:signal transduction histidine kinase
MNEHTEEGAMDALLRATGIPAVGDIAWGTHVCNFYRSPEDLVETLVPYFKAGLDHGEECLWVACPPFGVEAARSALGAAAPHLAEQLADGQIEILDRRDWYTRTGHFDPDEVLASWLAREERASARGRSGLRVTGNTAWVDDARGFRAFADYEERLNEALGGHRILVFCSYATDRCDCEGVFDVVRSHQLALVRRRGAWEVIEDAPLKIAKEELRRLNSDLEERVSQRTVQLESALRARDEFLCMASHELKTPLAALQLQIQGMLRAARPGVPAEAQAVERLDRTLGHSRRLTALVERMLDVSRAGSGQLRVEVATCDLRDLVGDALRRCQPQLKRAGIAATLRAAGEPIGRWDAQRLDQVLVGLLSNAIKFAPGDPVEIDVSVDGGDAVLRVRDHGPGIPARDRERIFERFVQLGSLPRPEGFGLGLWIARRIVAAHAGTIQAQDAEGGGAAFVVRMPLDAGLAPVGAA